MDERRAGYPLIVERLATVEEHIKSMDGKLDTVIETIGAINTRCFDRVEDYVLFKKHLQNGEKFRSIWQDRNFKVLLALVSPIYIALISFFIGWVSKQ
jgi:hypothetical protein